MAVELIRTVVSDEGAAVAYRVAPAASGRAARALVLVHGLASNLTRWSEFVEQTTLKERWDIVRVDLRGHGASPTRGRIGLDLWCEDLRAILDAEDYARAVLVGHSLGAQVALRFAARSPQRTLGLVLIDPVFREALHSRGAVLVRFMPLVRAFVMLARGLNKLGVRRRSLPELDLRALDIAARAALSAPGGAEAFIREYSSPLADLRYFPTAHYLQELVELFASPPPPEALPMPILVLISRGVTFADFDRTRAIAHRYPNAEIVTIEAYHWPLTERPLEVRRVIEEWCAGLEARVLAD